MLHLTLMGNILRAVDETPMTLYDGVYIPVYPNTVLSSKVHMSLTRAGRESFENFLEVCISSHRYGPRRPNLGHFRSKPRTILLHFPLLVLLPRWMLNLNCQTITVSENSMQI
jgi:Ferritin-like